MKVNTYGLPMTGLRAASGATKGLKGYYSGAYVQISYDSKSGEILTDFHFSLGQNSWIEYSDPDVITICYASCPMTMQDIADAIRDCYSYIRAYEARTETVASLTEYGDRAEARAC